MRRELKLASDKQRQEEGRRRAGAEWRGREWSSPGPINSSRSCAIGDTRDKKIKTTWRRRRNRRAVFTLRWLSEGCAFSPVAWIRRRDAGAASRYGRLSALSPSGRAKYQHTCSGAARRLGLILPTLFPVSCRFFFENSGRWLCSGPLNGITQLHPGYQPPL